MTTRFVQSRLLLSVALAAAIGTQATTSSPATAATPTAKDALGLKPIQPDVPYERVPDDAIDQCSVRDIDDKSVSGWEVIGPDGAILRRFADTDDDGKVDLWCYFDHGVEVYRDIDANGNGRTDQHRWLGTAGSRWGFDENEDRRIDRWKVISAEEVSAEVIASLANADAGRFRTLLATGPEIKSLGAGGEKTEQLLAKSTRAAADFATLAKGQKTVSPEATWVQFAAPAPGIVPAGTNGSSDDILAYENAVAMFDDAGRNGQVMVGTIVRVGDAWRLVELPSVGDGGDAIAQTTGNFFTPGGGPTAGAASAAIGEATQRWVTALEKIDTQLAAGGNAKTLAQLHARRADIVEELIAAAGNQTQREDWVRQLVDTLTVAVQSQAYPGGVNRLRMVSRKFAADDPALQAYADYAAIGTEYVARQTPKADFAKVQEWYIDSLKTFVERYPRTPEAAQAWLQLALSKEFEEKEREALGYYKKVARAFPGTDFGEKAAGAVRRLESEGRVISLRGEKVGGGTFDLGQLRGKPVVIHYWATWCEPCKQDMKALRRLQSSFSRAGLQIVGVNVDTSLEQTEAFLNANPLPWTHLFEPGGLELSPLAKSLGVQTLPTTMLIDASGKVHRHNVRVAQLRDELDEMLRKSRQSK